MRTRERVPLDWAATQNNLGAALGTLGAREDGTERLEQAVTAYTAALEVRTRERVPVPLRTTCGRTLATPEQPRHRRPRSAHERVPLGAREDGTERSNRPSPPTPRDPGGGREDGTERLEQAVTAYNAALEVRTRERVPLDWAATQNNLGNAALAGTLDGRAKTGPPTPPPSKCARERVQAVTSAYNWGPPSRCAPASGCRSTGP